MIYGLTFVSGLVLAVERPAMQAILFQLVGRDALPSAVAANTTIVSVSRLVGPALGGAMVAATGVASCFFANAVSYAVVLARSSSIRRSRLVPRVAGARAARSLRAAVAYVRHRAEVRRPLVVMAVVGLVALNFQTTFPSMVRFGFDRGAGAVGTAMSVSAIGSILGGIYAAGIDPEPAPDTRAGARSASHDAPRVRRRPRATRPSWRSGSRSASRRHASSRSTPSRSSRRPSRRCRAG